MTKDSSLLYFPNPLKSFVFSIELEDGTYCELREVKPLTFTIANATRIKDIKFVALAKKVTMIYLKPTLIKAGTTINILTQPYIDQSKNLFNMKYTVHTNTGGITACGKPTADVLFRFKDLTSNITLQPGTYAVTLGTFKNEHWDVNFGPDYDYRYNPIGKFHNKLFAESDYCDGYIWEKYHEPDNYVLTFAGYYNHIIYPSDKFVLRNYTLSEKFKNLTYGNGFFRGGRSKDLVIIADDYRYDHGSSHNTYYYVSQNGKDWKVTPGMYIGSRGRVGNWSRTSNTGIIAIHEDGNAMPYYYYAKVEKTGELKFDGAVQGLNGCYPLGEGGGMIFYVKNFIFEHDEPVYAINSKDRKEYLTQFKFNQTRLIYQMLNVGEWSHILSKIDSSNVWYIWSSKDGFKTVKEINSLSMCMPSYGTANPQIYYFEDMDGNGSYCLSIKRDVIENGRKRDGWDLYDYGSEFNNNPTIYYDVCNPVSAPIVGCKSAAVAGSFTHISYNPADYHAIICNYAELGGYWEYLLPNYPSTYGGRYQWQDLFWSTNGAKGTFYFKEGSLSEPYCMCVPPTSSHVFVMNGDGYKRPKKKNDEESESETTEVTVTENEDPEDEFIYTFRTDNDYMDVNNRTWVAPLS